MTTPFDNMSPEKAQFIKQKKEGILSPFWEIIYLLSILYDTRVKSSKSRSCLHD